MKKLLVGLFAILALSSCGKKDDSSNTAAPTIVGNWQLTTSVGVAVAEKDANEHILVYKADGTFKITNAHGDSYYGATTGTTYTATNGQIVNNYSDGSAFKGTFTVTATSLSLKGSSTGGAANEYIYKRITDQEMQQINARN